MSNEDKSEENVIDEEKTSKSEKLLAFIKNHKKRIIIISAIVIAVILSVVVLLCVFVFGQNKNQPTVAVPEEISGAVTQTEPEPVTEPVTETPPAEGAPAETVTDTPAEQTPDAGAESAEPTTPTGSDTEEASPSVTVQSSSAQKTGYKPLDTLTSKILSSITSSKMSSTEKLKAIYNYVRKKMTYNMFPPATNGLYDELISLGYSDYDANEMALAYDAATSYQGVCDNYAALTMILARAAGIPLFQSGGLSAKGSSHAWNVMFVNGEKYLVDTNYGIFMQRFDKSGYVEQMNGRSYFNNFKTTAPAVEEKKISWMFNAGYSSQRFLGNDRGEIKQTATINRQMHPDPSTVYPEPISPLLKVEGQNNIFSATVSSGGSVIETLKSQSGSEQTYYFSWYPPEPGSYVIEITVKSDDILTGRFIIYANLT